MLRDDPSTAGNPSMLAVAPVKEQCLSKTLGYSLRLIKTLVFDLHAFFEDNAILTSYGHFY